MRETGSARDLSLGMFLILTIGIVMWVGYDVGPKLILGGSPGNLRRHFYAHHVEGDDAVGQFLGA